MKKLLPLRFLVALEVLLVSSTLACASPEYQALVDALATGDAVNISDVALPFAQAAAVVYSNDGADFAEPIGSRFGGFEREGLLLRRITHDFELTELPEYRQNDPDTSFDVRVFESDDTLVIAFGGTKGTADIANDLILGLNGIPPQFALADRFVRQVREAHPDKRIVLCGHSLGGALAIFAGQRQRLDFVSFNGANLNNALWQTIPYENRASFEDRVQLNLRLSLSFEDRVALLIHELRPTLRTDIVSRLDEIEFLPFDESVVQVVDVPVQSHLARRMSFWVHEIAGFDARTIAENNSARELEQLLSEIDLSQVEWPSPLINQGTEVPPGVIPPLSSVTFTPVDPEDSNGEAETESTIISGETGSDRPLATLVFAGREYAVTDQAFPMSNRGRSLMQRVYGQEWQIADWNELKRIFATPGSPADALARLIGEYDSSAGLHRGGDFNYSSRRSYFVAAHYGSLPTRYNFLAHDNLQSHQISLGSWMANERRLLIVRDVVR